MSKTSKPIDWKRTVEDMPVGIAILDQSGRVVYYNNRLPYKTGVETDNWTKDPFSLIHPDSRKVALEAFKYILKGEFDKLPNPLLLKAIKRDGYQWVAIRVKAVDAGEKYTVLTFTDITERMVMQNKINNLLDYLKLLNSIMRHDLLNVFTSIHLYADLLKEKYDLEYVSQIEANVEKGVELIKKIRTLETAGDGPTGTYRIGDVVKEVSRGYNIKIEMKGDAEVMANDGIYSVFENLLSNAVKHGGANKITIEVWEENGKVSIRVKDNGIGIPEELRDRIFEKGVTSGMGSGLGMYIAKKLLETYGATIKLEDSKEGASFLIEFPK
ncbi:ATP-binding protein [Archaeoglobus sp.]